MDDTSRFILDFLEKKEIPIMGAGEEIVARLQGKLDIHNLSLTNEHLQNMVDEYGNEVLNPINDVDFNEDEY